MKPFMVTIKGNSFEEFSIYIRNANDDYTIDWGDGRKETYSEENTSIFHEYKETNEYQISIYADRISFELNHGLISAGEVLSVDQWGDIQWESMERMLKGEESMTLEADDTPNLENVESMHKMFSGARSVNSDISNWDVSSVEDMSFMFNGALSFNGNISNWDVSSVEDMSFMFCYALGFNQDISGWDVSNVTDMNSMFLGAESFDQDISNWDVSSVTKMCSMFQNAKLFNQDISKWDISNVKDMNRMFAETKKFNQRIDKWDIPLECNLGCMFEDAKAMEVENIPELVIIQRL